MMNRICGTTNAVYSNKDKVVDINASLDKYFALGDYGFEDNNQSDAPIQTIDLVSGTSRYEIDDLTSELLNFIRVEVTDDDGLDLIIYPNKISNIGEAYDEYYSDDGVPQVYFKIGKYIDVKPAPNYNKTGGLKIYFDRPASKYTFVSFTVVAATDVFAATAHGLLANDAVIFETDGTIPTGITADTVVYYVIASGLTADAFKVSTLIGGSTIDVTNAQTTSNHKFLKVSRTPGIPTIHHDYLARKGALNFLINKNLKNVGSVAQQVAMDEKAIKEYFGRRNKDEWQGMTMQKINFR